MADIPETRLSLIARLTVPDDQAAWVEFSSLYRPVVYRIARRKGLQHADAEDLAQQVLVAVARAIDDWEPDPARGRFRSWLRRIAENLTLNALTRRKPDRADGGSDGHDFLHAQPASDPADSALLRIEYRRELFQRAAASIRHEFQPETWAAFWRTTVEGADVEATARELGKNVGSIYAARSRVMRRLREQVSFWDDEGETS